MDDFAQVWWKIGTVMDWQRRMQPALAVLAEEYRMLVDAARKEGE